MSGLPKESLAQAETEKRERVWSGWGVRDGPGEAGGEGPQMPGLGVWPLSSGWAWEGPHPHFD